MHSIGIVYLGNFEKKRFKLAFVVFVGGDGNFVTISQPNLELRKTTVNCVPKTLKTPKTQRTKV